MAGPPVDAGSLGAQVGVGPNLLLGRGERAGGGRERPALLSRGFEALIGSIYSTAGWMPARACFLRSCDQEIQAGFSRNGS